MTPSPVPARRLLTERLEGRVMLDGLSTLMLGSNDYLGLSTDPAVLAATSHALALYGTGIGVYPSQATTPLHNELSDELADFLGVEAVALFSSGSSANGGVLATLVAHGDMIVSDRLNHASIIDGCRLSRADVVTYVSRDVSSLRGVLERTRQAARRLIITDGIFSMEGTAAPLSEIHALAQEHDALLVIDEAHATGVMGPGGTGTGPFMGLPNGSPGVLLTGSLSKALGGAGGGFVAGPRSTIEQLQRECRSWIFSQGMTTANLASALTALRRMRTDPSILQRMRGNATRLRNALEDHGVEVLPSDSAITAAMVGDEQHARTAAEALAKAGIYAPSKTYPVVARGEARLRLQVSAAHLPAELDQAAESIASVLGAQGAARRKDPEPK